jgi:hypothetical protein
MALSDKVRSRVEQVKPRVTECVIYARPLPLIADEKPPAGDDFSFKVVFDPTDRHLVALEPAERLELMKPFFAHGGCVILAIHKPTDEAIAKMWLLTYAPLPSDAKRGLLPINLAKDEAFLLDLWTHPDFRRQSVAFTLAYELGAAVDEFYPQLRWIYGYAHKDNEASRNLMELIYGMWAVQEIKEVEVGNYWVNVVPGSDHPKFGPFSKKGRHSGDGFQMPGRPRSGDMYRDYHHKEGFATGIRDAEVSDGWFWSGPEWFDNDHPVGADGRPGTPATLPRTLPGDAGEPDGPEEQAS